MLNEIDLSRIDLNLLVLFESVLTECHVGRAAEKLHLSPSAVSHGLGRLRRLFNDPLFLRTPKGVVPTIRATELAPAIAEILARVKNVITSAEPFNPATARRRFTIGAPDSISAVILQPLLAELVKEAPGIDISVRQLLPAPTESASSRPWRAAFAEIESRATDIAIIPSDDIPTRFHQRMLYQEDFVITLRAGHRYANTPTLKHYCEMQHVVVSTSGDPHGFIDEILAKHGYSRRVALTVPNFMYALSAIAESELLCALPRRFAVMYAGRFGAVSLEAPLQLRSFNVNAVASQAAMMDAGLSWLFGILVKAVQAAQQQPLRSPRQKKQRV
jgi:DNA-binding transcriptional LysR family regulator